MTTRIRMVAKPAGSAPPFSCRRRWTSPVLPYPLRLRLNCRSGPRPSIASFSHPIPVLALRLPIRSLPELRVAAGAVMRLSTPADLHACCRPWIRIHSHVDYYCCRTGRGRRKRRFALPCHLALAFLCRASRHTLPAQSGRYRIALSLQGRDQQHLLRLPLQCPAGGRSAVAGADRRDRRLRRAGLNRDILQGPGPARAIGHRHPLQRCRLDAGLRQPL